MLHTIIGRSMGLLSTHIIRRTGLTLRNLKQQRQISVDILLMISVLLLNLEYSMECQQRNLSQYPANCAIYSTK